MSSRSRRRGALAIGAVAALAFPFAAAQAAPPDDLGNADDFGPRPEVDYSYATTGRWFIEFKSDPVALGGSQHQINREQQAFLDAARRQGAPAQVESTYTDVFNGIAVEADDETAALYSTLPTVAAVYPVFAVAPPETFEASPALASAITMTGVDIARSELGLTGEGVTVAIIDSGVDYNHPDLGGDGVNDETAFPTARVPLGWDFVGDTYNANPNSENYQPTPQPDPYPDDCGGHGTHVAGIVGASAASDDGVTGVAPDVKFAAYRVFGCDGSSDTQIILDALERALQDGVDVVNMSLGAAFQSWPNYPTGAASATLVEAGIVVVGSAGNEGSYYTMATGSPGAGEAVISTASFDNVELTLPGIDITIGDETKLVGYTSSTGSPDWSSDLDGLPLVLADPLNGCSPVADASGHVLVMQRGGCTFHAKAAAAQDAGASALIIANNAPGVINMTVEGDVEITIPVIGVSGSTGNWMIPALAESEGTSELADGLAHEPNPTGGLVSTFSSWGLAADLTLKPDLGAPGGSIYSTLPLEEGKYGSLSGTSMSAPHVAGAVALMLQSNPDLSPAEVLARLQNTASPKPWNLVPSYGILDAAHHQGAGLIDVPRAVQSTTVISPGKISAGEGADGPHNQVLTISNSSDEPVRYALDYEPALATWADYDDPDSNSQNWPGFYLFDADVLFSQSEVTVPAHGQIDVTVSISPAEGTPEGAMYTGYLTFTDEEGTTAFTVPYAGMAGDYGNLPIHTDPFGYGIPSLGIVSDCKIVEDNRCQDENATIELTDGSHTYRMGEDLPSIITHFDNPAESVTVKVIRVLPNGKPFPFATPRHAFTVDYVGRNSGIAVWQWDGYVDGPWGIRYMVLPGYYKMEMSATTADGDGNVQKYTTPTFRVQNFRAWLKMPIIWKP